MIRLVKTSQGFAQIPYPQYGVSQTLVVGGGPTPVPVTGAAINSSGLVIQPSVDVRFKVSKSGEPATANDPIAWARRDTYIGFPPNHFISFVKENGEEDGQVVITPLEEV